MSREINLIDYLPPFLQGYREMQAIMTAENPEFQAVSDEGQVVLDNTFILYCNEDGIARFERMLGIYPLPSDPLEARQSRVLTRWNDTVPYTLKTFLVKLKTLQGNDNVQVIFDKDTYTLQVVTHLEKQGQQDDLAYLLKTVVPCNLLIDSVNILNCISSGSLTMGAGITYAGIEFITNDINETFGINTEIVFGTGISNTGIQFITNDIDENFDISTQAALANVITSTEVISII